MTEKMQPSRRAVVQTAASVAAMATLNVLSTTPAVGAAPPPEQGKQPAPPHRVPVGLL
ncbi:hypothetical protein [Leifsonia sp. Le1]|uniref:hypothetical protein n=1 Tax=Leifsonia sp. Le1 TaxID=3404918 RepID=UPI003EB89AF2